MVLAELYITFEIIGFVLFLKGIEERRVVYPMVSMVLFFSLAVMGGTVEAIFHGASVTSTEGIMFNYMFALVSFIFVIVTIMEYMKKGVEGEKLPEEI